MLIREFQAGDEAGLLAVFRSAVHGSAARDYDAQQLEAWAPASIDAEQWAQRMRRLRPFVVLAQGRIVAYADLQADGYIDHFFVAATHGGRGAGRLLMERIHAAARQQGIASLRAEVSLTAQPFFRHFGFQLQRRQEVVVRGVVLENAMMSKRLP